jgi:hypothetical protein
VVGGPSHVVAHEQIEEPVAIDVDPHGGRAEGLAAAKPAGARDVDECAFAGVPEQPVLADGGHEEIGKSVVVEVAGGHAHSV